MINQRDSKYLPQLRGWVALVLGVFSPLYFTFIRPPIFERSGGPPELLESVSASTWFIGGLLILISGIACVEAVRRGNVGDRVVAGIAAVCVVLLLAHYCSLIVMKSRSTNHANALAGGIALQFHTLLRWPAASDVQR